jgi:hypothetical protein
MFGDDFFVWVAGIRGLTLVYAASDGETPMMVDERAAVLHVVAQG